VIAVKRDRPVPEIRSLGRTPDADWQQARDAEIERRAMEVENGIAETMSLNEYRTHVRRRRAARVHR
jgi:hypothetical protein